MKTKKLFLFITLLLGTTLLFTLNSCKKSYPTDCYKGEIVALASGGDNCFDFIRILISVKGGIPTKAILSFSNPQIYDTYGKTLKLGDIIYFKITNYKKYELPDVGYCAPPEYVLVDKPIELCQ